MHCLSLPLPVARLLKRLFNVVSTLALSNQYIIARKAEIDAGGDNTAKWKSWNLEKAPIRDLLSARFTDVGNSFSSGADELLVRWHRLRAWNAISNLKLPHTSCRVHSLSAQDISSFEDSKDSEYLNEKSIHTPPPSISSSSPHSNPDPVKRSPSDQDTATNAPVSPIYQLYLSPVLYDPVRKPRNPIVLCHGLYGFDVRGPASFPFLQMQYWGNVLKVLKKTVGVDVIVTGVPGTGSVASRAESMDKFLREKARGQKINFIAHSMGGLDCRHLITHVKPEEYTPVSLTTVCTPHRGSPFMDWCTENIGLGKIKQGKKPLVPPDPPPTSSGTRFSLSSLPSSFTTLLLSIFDSPAYACLTTQFLENEFNPSTPDSPNVKCYSIAARTESMNVWHPLWLPKMVLDGIEEKERVEWTESGGQRPPSWPPLASWEIEDWGNDGLVSVRSAKWGEFLGTMEGCDHWDIRGSRGLSYELDWRFDLSLPTSVKNSLTDPLSKLDLHRIGEGWSWPEWARFVGAWRQEQEKHAETGKTSTAASPRERGLKQQHEETDHVVKASTEKLSAVFDWITEQVPNTLSSKGKSQTPSPTKSAMEVEKKKKEETKDPRLKFDLERFYVALSRKLYDDGF